LTNRAREQAGYLKVRRSRGNPTCFHLIEKRAVASLSGTQPRAVG